MAENMIKFLRGNVANLPANATAGAVYFTKDEGLYLGLEDGSYHRYGDFITVADVASLPESGAHETCMYYCETENILAKWDGSKWVQINKQKTLAELGGVAKSVYDAKMTALEKADSDNANAAAKAQTDVDNLKTYVGTIPTDYTETNVIAYVNKKAEETLSAAQGGSSETAASVKQQLDNYKSANDTRVKAAEDAITAIKDGAAVDSFADVEAELAKKVDKETGKSLIADTEITRLAGMSDGANKVEASTNGKIKIDGEDVTVYVHPEKHTVSEISDFDASVKAYDYATKDEAQGYANAKDDAIAAAKNAADAVAAKVGTVEDGTTVVEMIGNVETLANQKVASVTASDKSVTIGGTTTAPTVAAKLSADADNALELAEDGLKVVIPAAAEYSIVKAANSSDYAAVYNLTKDGEIVGESINIPKDMVVEAGSVVENPEGQPAGTYIKLVLQNVAEPLFINVGSLIEYVTSGSADGDMVVIAVDDNHKVTAEITDGAITLGKLATDVQTKINKAHSHENATVLDGITADKVEAWDAAEGNAKAHATDLNNAMNTRVAALEGKVDVDKVSEAISDAVLVETNRATGAENGLSDRIKNIEDNKAGYATTGEVATAKQEAIDAAATAAQTKVDALANSTVKANTEAIATKAAQADLEAATSRIGTAEGKITALEQASATHALKTEVEGVADDLAKYKTSNDAAVAKKANSADVYAKTETYTQEQVDAAIAAAVTAGLTWGTFGN